MSKQMPFWIKKIILALAILAPLSVFPSEFSGTVVGITDGDTLEVLTTQKQIVKIRLVEIDAPEKKQAFGQQSKQSLSDICFKKTVIVDDKGLEKYHRTLGRLRCDGIDANAEQVKRGMAWAYRKYLTDPTIADFELAAKTDKLGLWLDDDPVPPSDFRHGGKAVKKPTEKSATGSGFTCGDKRHCKEMSNCEEAKFYMTECGISKLDRNHDGVPCESLCR
jgi:endonuclease YncB( thermonuclease family)